MNFSSRLGAKLPKQIAAVFGYGRDKFSRRADFTQELVIAEVGHEILTMRGHAEGDAGNFLYEEGSMCGPIGKMHAEVSHAAAGKKIGEVESVARSLSGLECLPIFLLVKIDK